MAVAATTTQATLKANIDGYMHRTFTTGELSQFVASAGKRIGRDLRSTAQELVGSLRPVGGIAELPARCVEIRSIKLISGAQVRADGFSSGQMAAAAGDAVIYHVLGQNAAGRRLVELWPPGTDVTATQAVTSLSSVTTLATCTTTAVHGLATGAFVDFSGHTSAEYNNTFGPITVTNTTVFTFAVDADFTDASGGTILMRPATILLHYYEAPDSTFALGDTNPVLDAHPELYLNACLLEASNYTRDDDNEAKYSQRYIVEKDQINAQARAARWGSFPAAQTNVNMAASPACGL